LVRDDSAALEHGGILPGAQRLQVIVAFVDPALSALVSFFFLLFFSWACLCCLPQRNLTVVPGGCYINIAGRKPISKK
jgi:hypothetical protein